MNLEEFKKKCIEDRETLENGQGERWTKLKQRQRKYGPTFHPKRSASGERCPVCDKSLGTERLWVDGKWAYDVLSCEGCGYEFAVVSVVVS